MISKTLVSRGRNLVTQQRRTISSKAVLVPVASGSEEIETVTIVDVLRRAGADVTLAKVATKQNGQDLKCLMSRGINLIADASLTD